VKAKPEFFSVRTKASKAELFRFHVASLFDDLKETINGRGGSGVVRALKKSARAKGVEILPGTS
jgi:hypothetical protein